MATVGLCRTLYLAVGGFLFATAAVAPASHGQNVADSISAVRAARIENLVTHLDRGDYAENVGRIIRERYGRTDSLADHPEVRRSNRRIANHFAILHSADDLSAAERAGADIFRAKMRAEEARAKDFKYASDLVVIATLINVVPYENLGDGYTSTLTFRVDELFRGPPGLASVRVREISGLLPDGTKAVASVGLFWDIYDAKTGTVRPGSQWVLFLSRGMYQARAAMNGLSPASVIAASSSNYDYLLVPSEIRGDKVHHSGQIHLNNVPTSLAALRRDLLEVGE